jgi:chromosome segregation ATPase
MRSPKEESMEKEKESCQNCKFWKRHRKFYENGVFTDPVHGDCLKRAPILVIEGGEAGETHHPEKHESGWCGEFESREDQDQPKEKPTDPSPEPSLGDGGYDLDFDNIARDGGLSKVDRAVEKAMEEFSETTRVLAPWLPSSDEVKKSFEKFEQESQSFSDANFEKDFDEVIARAEKAENLCVKLEKALDQERGKSSDLKGQIITLSKELADAVAALESAKDRTRELASQLSECQAELSNVKTKYNVPSTDCQCQKVLDVYQGQIDEARKIMEDYGVSAGSHQTLCHAVRYILEARNSACMRMKKFEEKLSDCQSELSEARAKWTDEYEKSRRAKELKSCQAEIGMAMKMLEDAEVVGFDTVCDGISHIIMDGNKLQEEYNFVTESMKKKNDKLKAQLKQVAAQAESAEWSMRNGWKTQDALLEKLSDMQGELEKAVSDRDKWQDRFIALESQDILDSDES